MNIELCGAENWTLRKLKNRNTSKVLKRVAGGEERSVGPIKRREANWIGYILRRKSSITR